MKINFDKNNLKVVKIEEIRPNSWNPKNLDTPEFNKIVESIKTNGQRAPIYCRSKDGFEIVDGEQRYRAMLKLGYKEALIYDFGALSDKEAKELTVWFQQQVPFDEEKEARFVLDFIKEVPDFNLPYSEKELLKFEEFFIGDLEEDDESAYLGDGDVKSKLGEVYALGDHRLICGDSTDLEVYKKLFGDKKARLIYTDPPYNVGYDYTVTQVEGRKRKSQFKSFDDSKKDEDFIEFLYTVFTNALMYSTDDSCFYCWHATKTQDLFRRAIEKAQWRVSQVLYWLKDRPTFSRGLDYLYITEPCYFGWKIGQKHYYNPKYSGSFVNTELLDFDDFESLLNVLYERRDSNDDYSHPTQKPIGLAKRPLARHSERKDIVLDMFGGSGSTLLACEQLGRICYMIELDPKYCDVIRKRYAKLVGKEAEWEKITKKI